MHRAKHRRAGADTAVLATTLLERFAPVPAQPADDRAVAGPALFGAAPRTSPMLAVPHPGEAPVERSPFGAARHAVPVRPAFVPGPRVVQSSGVAGGRPRPQPVGAALSVTVLGAAAAVTAIVAPPTAVETTGSLVPVQGTAPSPAGAPGLAAADLAAANLAAAPQAPADRPALEVGALVTEVTGEMQRVDRPFTTVAQNTALSSPAAMRRAAMSNALGKLGKPYRWGAMGPNAFDCSGLVKWSFGSAGRSLPRTSRAMAAVGTPVSKADLQPGDLVFFYRPVSHVGIYIGNGKIVHASRSGQPVKISNVNAMTFSGARRV